MDRSCFLEALDFWNVVARLPRNTTSCSRRNLQIGQSREAAYVSIKQGSFLDRCEAHHLLLTHEITPLERQDHGEVACGWPMLIACYSSLTTIA